MTVDYRAVVEARNQGLIDTAIAAIKDWIRRVLRQPGGLVTLGFDWDSGEDGVVLVASATRRTPPKRCPFPAVLNRWDIFGEPAGDATVTVYMAAPGVTLSAATVIATLTVSGAEENSNTAIAEVTIPDGARLYCRLPSTSAFETLAADLELRRVPDDA